MGFPVKLYRSIELKYARSFVEEGEVMFRPLSYYREIEDDQRRDSKEGIVTRKFTHGTIEIADATWDSGKRLIPITKANIDLTTDNAGQIYASCFSILPKTKSSDALVEVSNPEYFVASLSGMMKELDIVLKWGLIEYYDDQSVDLTSAEQKIGFMKSTYFSEEKEFRLAFLLHDNNTLKSELEKLPMKERYMTFSSKSFAKYTRRLD